MSTVLDDPLPTRRALIRRSIDHHQEGLCRDLQYLCRSAYPQKLIQTVKDKPVSSMLAVAGASFLLAQIAYGLRRRHHQPHPSAPPGPGLLARLIRALMSSQF